VGQYDQAPPPNPMDDAVRASEVTANVPFVYITVDNMARSLTFYEHFGFRFPTEAYGEAHVEAELKNGMLIFWNHVDMVRIYAPDYHPAAHGRIGLSFQLESAGALDALFHKLRGLGYKVDREPWDAPWGHRYFVVYDPDGNSVNVFAPHL
jgi:uncharacterized glyoxalase superfamily protein PhnB